VPYLFQKNKNKLPQSKTLTQNSRSLFFTIFFKIYEPLKKIREI